MLEKIVENDKKVIIFGHMNLNVGRKCKNVTSYLNTIDHYNLCQLINEPTRVNCKSKTIIDHLITNRNGVKWQIIKESPTDHFMIEAIVNCRNIKVKNVKKKK